MTTIGDRMKGLAFIQIRAAREAGGGLLDFSPASLGELEKLMDRDVPREPKDPEAIAEVIGAYLGETLVRRLKAEWEETEGGPRLRLGALLLDPVRQAAIVVAERREGGLYRYFERVRDASELGRAGEGWEGA